MSKDRLEKFIVDHRDEFDDYEPNPALFKGVKTRRPVIRMIKWNSPLCKAAAVVVIFVSSYFFHDWMIHRSQDNQTADTQTGISSEIVNMLIEAKACYNRSDQCPAGGV